MARINIPVVTATANAGVDETAGTAIDASNGMVITPKRLSRLLVVIAEIATSKAVTFKAGAYPSAALEVSQGDLIVDPSVTVRTVVGPFTGGRFSQTDGSVRLDFANGALGTVWAYEIGRAGNVP